MGGVQVPLAAEFEGEGIELVGLNGEDGFGGCEFGGNFRVRIPVAEVGAGAGEDELVVRCEAPGDGEGLGGAIVGGDADFVVSEGLPGAALEDVALGIEGEGAEFKSVGRREVPWGLVG